MVYVLGYELALNDAADNIQFGMAICDLFNLILIDFTSFPAAITPRYEQL